MFARVAVLALLATAVSGQSCSSAYRGDISEPLRHLIDQTIPPGPPDSDITLAENLCYPLIQVGTVVTVCENLLPAPTVTLYDFTHGHLHRNVNSYASSALLRVGYKCV